MAIKRVAAVFDNPCGENVHIHSSLLTHNGDNNNIQNLTNPASQTPCASSARFGSFDCSDHIQT